MVIITGAKYAQTISDIKRLLRNGEAGPFPKRFSVEYSA